MPRRKKLSFVDKYYIEHNRNLDAKAIAVSLGVDVAAVEAEIESINAKLAAQKPPTSFEQPADGVVSMTGAQSMKDDQLSKESNTAYFDRYKGNIAPIREGGLK